MRDYKVSSDVCSSDLRDVLQKQLEALKARTSSDSVQHRLLDQIEDISTQKLRERSEEHTSELQSPCNLVCRLLLEKKTATCISRQTARRTMATVPPSR